jgi:hypothetical protein
VNFPQFRKHESGVNFYEIHDATNFTEYQRIGNKIFVHRIKTTTYFETLRIQEMLNLDGCYLVAEEMEVKALENG